jgi:NAD(P)-dependent dehydrogenase (short-subunit alcohol dehydrogenase family)
MDHIDFRGRAAVVTGAGNGLGRSYAMALAERGAAVVVNDFGCRPDGNGAATRPADDVVAEITAAGGAAVASYESVATAEGGEAIVAQALEAFDRLDIVINNAGILRDCAFHKMGQPEFESVLDVHLRGAVHVSQPAFRVMRKAGFGRILFTASAAGLFGNFGQANYATAKMGVVGLSNVLAIEGARFGITSNVIAPVASTRLTQEVLADQADAFNQEFVTPLVVFLVSESCTASHEIFSVGGGRYARVFVGVTPGWHAPSEIPTPEAVGEAFEEIRTIDDFIVPGAALDELQLIERIEA